jgi:hypothetical protein
MMSEPARAGVFTSPITLSPSPCSQKLDDIVAYWKSKREPPAIPGRKDIDPVEIAPKLLPRLFLLDLVDGHQDARYRLVGTALVDWLGRDATGFLISDLYRNDGDMLSKYHEAVRRVATDKQPVYASGSVSWIKNRQFSRFECVFLPLASDGQTVDIILGSICLT